MADDEPARSDRVAVLETEAGVDWLTLLCDYRREQDEALAVVDELQRGDMAQGHRQKAWRWQGYEGWLTPSIRAGWMSGRLCLQLSGKAAATQWTRLASSTGRVSRLDVQTTVSLSQAVPGFGTRFLRRVGTTHRPPPQSSPVRARSRDTAGLWLGTVGRRTAPRYIRVYDKGVESGDAPAGVKWRVEVESKQQLAGEMWNSLTRAENPQSFCLEQCRAQLRSAGCCWPSIVPTSAVEPIRAPAAPESPAHSLLAWYRSGVAPTLPRVLAVYDVAAVLEALGIDHLAQPRGPVDGD